MRLPTSAPLARRAVLGAAQFAALSTLLVPLRTPAIAPRAADEFAVTLEPGSPGFSVRDLVVGIVQPLLDRFKPKNFARLDIATLTLGTVAPRVCSAKALGAMKVLSRDAMLQELFTFAVLDGRKWADFAAEHLVTLAQMPRLLVLGAVFTTGLLVELGAKRAFNGIADAVLKRVPLISSIYSTSKQVVEMLDSKDEQALKSMTAVYCFFGETSPTGLLAFLVSPEVFHVNGKDFHIVIIPTAPVPFGGAMIFVPAETVVPADMPIDALMSIYVSMGATAPQYLQTAAASDPT